MDDRRRGRLGNPAAAAATADIRAEKSMRMPNSALAEGASGSPSQSLEAKGKRRAGELKESVILFKPDTPPGRFCRRATGPAVTPKACEAFCRAVDAGCIVQARVGSRPGKLLGDRSLKAPGRHSLSPFWWYLFLSIPISRAIRLGNTTPARDRLHSGM